MNAWLNIRIWKVAWPVCLGYIPLGLACGIFAQKAGLSVFEVLGMCLIIYAGSGQFIGIAMMTQMSSVVSIALTIFVVNLRHFLFSSALSKYLKEKSPAFLSFYAYQITDEAFAVNMASFDKGDWSSSEAVKVNIICHSSWVLSNIAGFISGGLIQVDTQIVGYALTVMFIGLWSAYLGERKMFIAGLASGVLATVLAMFICYKMHIVLAAIIISSFFCYYELKHS